MQDVVWGPRKGGRGSPCGEGSWEEATGYASTQSLGGMRADIQVSGGRGAVRTWQNLQLELGAACTLELAQANTVLPPMPRTPAGIPPANQHSLTRVVQGVPEDLPGWLAGWRSTQESLPRCPVWPGSGLQLTGGASVSTLPAGGTAQGQRTHTGSGVGQAQVQILALGKAR